MIFNRFLKKIVQIFIGAIIRGSLEQMKANYSSIEEKLQQYESEPEKLEVLASEEYSQIKDTDAYKELAKRDTYFSMSKDELVEKLDACLLEFAKHNEPILTKLSGRETGCQQAERYQVGDRDRLSGDQNTA